MRFRLSSGWLLPLPVLPMLLFAASSEGPVAGKELYSSRCSMCHGDSGEGREAIFKMLGATMQPLYSKEVQALSDAAARKVIAEGKGKMKPVKLSPKETDAVIAYVRTLKK